MKRPAAPNALTGCVQENIPNPTTRAIRGSASRTPGTAEVLGAATRRVSRWRYAAQAEKALESGSLKPEMGIK